MPADIAAEEQDRVAARALAAELGAGLAEERHGVSLCFSSSFP